MTEEEVKAAFLSAYNKLVSEKAEIVANAETIRETLCRTDALEEEKCKIGRASCRERVCLYV